jgi:hypothetical protein
LTQIGDEGNPTSVKCNLPLSKDSARPFDESQEADDGFMVERGHDIEAVFAPCPERVFQSPSGKVRHCLDRDFGVDATRHW